MSKTIALTSTLTARATDEQASVLEALKGAHSGFASFKGYKATSGMVKPSVKDLIVNIKAKPETVNQNRIKALKNICFNDLDLSGWIPSKGKDAFDNAHEQFAFCLGKMIASANGNGSESHRQAHDDHSVYLDTGIKVWLNDDADESGLRSVKSVLVYGLPVSEKVIDKGERKQVNSGSKVLMDSAIERVWNARACGIRSYNPLNAASVKAGGMEM